MNKDDLRIRSYTQQRSLRHLGRLQSGQRLQKKDRNGQRGEIAAYLKGIRLHIPVLIIEPYAQRTFEIKCKEKSP